MTDKPTYLLVPAVATADMLVSGTEDWLVVRALEDRADVIYGAMLAARPASYIALEAAWKDVRRSADYITNRSHDVGCACILCNALTALSKAETAVKKEIGS